MDLLSQACEAVDHRLKLFLDVEVFEEEEEFHSFVKVRSEFGLVLGYSFLVLGNSFLVKRNCCAVQTESQGLLIDCHGF